MTDFVQHKVAGHDLIRNLPALARRDRADACNQFFDEKRLGQIVVSADLKALQPVRQFVARAEKNDGDRIAHFPNLGQHLEAAQYREHHIEYYQIVLTAEDGVQAVRPVGDVRDLESGGAQIGYHEFCNTDLVLDQQQLGDR